MKRRNLFAAIALVAVIAGISLFFSSLSPAHAIDFTKKPTGISTATDISDIILIVSQWIIDIVGAVAVLALIYGGFTYVIAAGNEKEVEKAKEIIKYSIIGLVIVIISFTIVSSVNALFPTSDSGANNIHCQCDEHGIALRPLDPPSCNPNITCQ